MVCLCTGNTDVEVEFVFKEVTDGFAFVEFAALVHVDISVTCVCRIEMTTKPAAEPIGGRNFGDAGTAV